MTFPISGARRTALAALALLLVASSGCDLTVSDPNATTEDDAFGTRTGLLTAAVGLQRQYNSVAYDNLVLTTGITSRELAADNTFANLLDLDGGGAGLPADNANVTGYFREMYQTIATADRIIGGVQATETVEPELASGLVALAEFYKAASIGALAVGFTDVALETSVDAPATYVDRVTALQAAADLLASAEGRLAATPPNRAFRDILPAGFNVLNSVRAYRARFALLAGDLDEALAAAMSVDLGATSVFAYDGTIPNPLYRSISPQFGQPSFAVRDNLGLAGVESGDGRIDYFTDPGTTPANDRSVNGYPIDVATGFIVGGDEVGLPVYIPDEMRLIMAEVYARRGNVDDAVAAIDAVRTDEVDPFGLAADLDAYSGATDLQSLLDEIYYNRATELYLQGLRLEDQRRLNQGPANSADPFSRSRNFYPFPRQERLANPDTTPPDPAI